jgi:protein-tyrosine-phosphatase
MSATAPPGTILVVCTGNICRSPMGARLLRHALDAEPEPLRSLRIDSAGLAASAGQRATENSTFALRKVGLDLAEHCAQPLTQAMLDEALAVFCMTETHRMLIEVNFAPPPGRLHLFREFLGDGADLEIPDPYGQNLAAYEACRDSMVEAIPSLVRYLRELVAAKAG